MRDACRIRNRFDIPFLEDSGTRTWLSIGSCRLVLHFRMERLSLRMRCPGDYYFCRCWSPVRSCSCGKARLRCVEPGKSAQAMIDGGSIKGWWGLPSTTSGQDSGVCVCAVAFQRRHFVLQSRVSIIGRSSRAVGWTAGPWRLESSRVLSNVRSFGWCPIDFGWSAGVRMWI